MALYRLCLIILKFMFSSAAVPGEELQNHFIRHNATTKKRNIYVHIYTALKAG